MSFSDNPIDKIEASFRSLASDVNSTSTSARTGWIFFLAIQAYFFVALAGLEHRDILLDTPVTLPLLQVEIRLRAFFLFGPIILVLFHLGILLQLVMLARQVRELHGRVAILRETATSARTGSAFICIPISLHSSSPGLYGVRFSRFSCRCSPG